MSLNDQSNQLKLRTVLNRKQDIYYMDKNKQLGGSGDGGDNVPSVEQHFCRSDSVNFFKFIMESSQQNF